LIYELNLKDLKKLDGYEKDYRKIRVKINNKEVYTYEVINKKKVKPSKEYLDIIKKAHEKLDF